MKTLAIPMLLTLAVAATPAASFAKGATAPNEALIAQQFQLWNDALQTRDANKVAALYCEPGGILIPTLSNRVRSDRAEIVDYFEHFLQLKPVGTIDQSFIRILDPDAAIDSGIYTFHLSRNGKSENVQARYTFVYARQHGTWCIMEQHSSAMPENAAGPASHP